MTAKNTVHITIPCTPQERERWRAAANEDTRSLAAWIRLVLNKSSDPLDTTITIHYEHTTDDKLHSYAVCNVKPDGTFVVVEAYRTTDILSPGTVWTEESLRAHKGITGIDIMEGAGSSAH